MMAMVESPTARSKLDPPAPVIEPQRRFQQPTIWWKGPDEHIREDHHASRVDKQLLPHLQYGTKLKQPPPGHVRLLFWWSLDELKTLRPKAQMSADIPLDPGGSLDLLKVQKLWGLESVKIIDPLRWKIFETVDPNRLSALGVRDLLIERHLFVTEDPATRSTVFKRALRLLCIDLYFLSFLGLYQLIFYGGFNSKQRVPVPTWYDNTVDLRNGVVYQLEGVKREISKTYTWALNLFYREIDDTSLHTRPPQGGTPVIQWLDHVGSRGREFVQQWGLGLVTCVLFCLVMFVDGSVCFKSLLLV